jgi:hypothetical protein
MYLDILPSSLIGKLRSNEKTGGPKLMAAGSVFNCTRKIYQVNILMYLVF